MKTDLRNVSHCHIYSFLELCAGIVYSLLSIRLSPMKPLNDKLARDKPRRHVCVLEDKDAVIFSETSLKDCYLPFP